MLLAPLFATLVLVGHTNAFFRLPCDNPLIVERVDPIVSFGKVGGHTHTIAGASNFSPNATFADLRKSTCTSCRVKQDMSNYWSPQLYIEWANNTFSSVDQVGGTLVYYLQRSHPTDKTKVLAFPDGLKMLTGNPFLRTYDPKSLEVQAIGWNCLGGAQPTRTPYLPSNNCPNGLRGEVRFPSCWDGKNVDSLDHKSHVAYSDGESGPCPATHPNRIATLFFEVMYSVDPLNKFRSQAKNPTQPLVLATGDPIGTGYHADFFNGWDRQVLQTALDTCTSASGVIEECKVLDLYDRATEGSCRKTPDVNEIVLGNLKTLPGCNPTTTATLAPSTCSLPVPPLFLRTSVYTGSAAPPRANVLSNTPRVLLAFKNWRYQDCYSDRAPSRALPHQLRIETKTVQACLLAAEQAGYAFAALEFYGECWAGNELATTSKAIGFGECGAVCSDNLLQYCGGTSRSMTLYQRKVATTAARRRSRHAGALRA